MPKSLPDDTGAKTPELVSRRRNRRRLDRRAALVQFGEKTLRQRSGLFRPSGASVGPDRLQGSVQPPDRRRIDAEMNIGCAACCAMAKILVYVREIARLLGCFRRHNPVPILMHRAACVNLNPSTIFRATASRRKTF